MSVEEILLYIWQGKVLTFVFYLKYLPLGAHIYRDVKQLLVCSYISYTIAPL